MSDLDVQNINSKTGNSAISIADDGKVGIGTTTPNDLLHIKSTSADAEITLETSNSGGDARLRLKASSTAFSSLQFQDENDSNVGFLNYDHSDNSMQFRLNDSEKVRIDSSGNFGIGTSDPNTLLEIASSAPTLRISNTENKSWTGNDPIGQLEWYTNDTSAEDGGTRVGASINVVAGANSSLPYTDMTFHTSAAAGTDNVERMRILAQGGITFNGDTATANALDDYEEGTWTPQINSNGSLSDATTSNLEGVYTKIGRLVTCQIRWNFSDNGTDTGHLGITLPFAVADIMNTTAVQGGGSLSWYSDVDVTHSVIYCSPWEGTSEARFGYLFSTTSASASMLNVDDVGNGFDGRLTVTYLTA